MLSPVINKLLILLLVVGSAAILLSCSSQTVQHSSTDSALQSAGLVPDPVIGAPDAPTQCEIPAVLHLWAVRSDRASASVQAYSMGPGDELEITVPEVEELQNQHARISQTGTVSLPLIGTVRLTGLDEDQARAVITQRIARYMRRPRVELYVNRYRSRGVAVSGAVQKPGVYDLASFGDSLNDMIAMAGGLSQYAAQRVLLLPEGMLELSSRLRSEKPGGSAIQAVAHSSASGANKEGLARRIAITIALGRSGDAGCLNMPARPGDVLIIPTAGNVTVVGWVRNPGSFPITPGMTVLGAVTAAGGALFSSRVEILRVDQSGVRVTRHFTLSALEDGDEPDTSVDAGDVVVLEKSALGAIPYGLWQLFNRFGSGVGVGIPVP